METQQTHCSSGVHVRRIPTNKQFISDLPTGFVPLRLMAQSGELCLELVQPDLLLGRHSSADIRIPIPDVSRKHCRFVFDDGQWEVLDLNSLNGTFVNEARLNRSVLRHSDTIRVGGFAFVVMQTSSAERNRENEHYGAVVDNIIKFLPTINSATTEEYRRAS